MLLTHSRKVRCASLRASWSRLERCSDEYTVFYGREACCASLKASWSRLGLCSLECAASPQPRGVLDWPEGYLEPPGAVQPPVRCFPKVVRRAVPACGLACAA